MHRSQPQIQLFVHCLRTLSQSSIYICFLLLFIIDTNRFCVSELLKERKKDNKSLAICFCLPYQQSKAKQASKRASKQAKAKQNSKPLRLQECSQQRRSV